MSPTGSTTAAGGLAAAAEQVGDTDWIAMQELAENHGLALPREKR